MFTYTETPRLPTIFSVPIMGYDREGLSPDHLYNVCPGPKVHFVAVTKSQVINFD